MLDFILQEDDPDKLHNIINLTTVNCPTNDIYETYLHQTIKLNFPLCVKKILEIGGISSLKCINLYGQNAFHLLCQSETQSITLLKILMNPISSNGDKILLFTSNDFIRGNTPIHNAIESNCSAEFMNMLLDVYSVPCNVSNKNGQIPLHLSILKNNYNLCKKIVSANGYIDVVDSNGFTPYMLACSLNYQPIADYLLSVELNEETEEIDNDEEVELENNDDDYINDDNDDEDSLS